MADEHDILGIDEETTGLFLMKEPSASPKQHRVVELGWVICRPSDGRSLKNWSGFFRPTGFALKPALEEYLGITNAELQRYGHDPKVVLANLLSIISMWPRPLMMLGHNIPFDLKGLRVEAERAGIRADYDKIIAPLPTFDTQREAEAIVQLPPTDKMKQYAFTRNKFKAPKLEEAFEFFNGRKPDRSHAALDDVFSAISVYLGIKAHRNGAVTPREPKAPVPLKPAATEVVDLA